MCVQRGEVVGFKSSYNRPMRAFNMTGYASSTGHHTQQITPAD
jgi:hypothetical protein